MKQVITLVLILLTTSLTLAQVPDSYLGIAIPQGTGNPVEVKRGDFLTRTASYQGLSIQFQETGDNLNWTYLSTSEAKLLDGPIKISAAPVMMWDREGRGAYGASIRLRFSQAVEISHSSQFGNLSGHYTTARVAPKSPLSLTVMRTVTGNSVPITRVGPELRVGRRTRLWYGHATGNAPNQLLVTSNLRF